jgi:hypothetical protein
VKIFFPLSPVKPTIIKFGINYSEGQGGKSDDEEKSVVKVVVILFRKKEIEGK